MGGGETSRSFEVRGVSFFFVPVPAGETTIGITRTEVQEIKKRFAGRDVATDDSFPQRTEHVDAFWILDQEITEQQWAAVMEPEKLGTARNTPKTDVSFEQAQDFMRRLRAEKSLRVDFPSEVQFEHAAKTVDPTGKSSPTDTSLTCIDREGAASYQYGNRRDTVTARDLLSGVWEMTLTNWRSYPGNEGREDDSGAIAVRGGCTACSPHECLPVSRWRRSKEEAHPMIGFRIVAYFK